MTIEQINQAIKNVDTNRVSDGYHTFGELYDHRIALFIALCWAMETNEAFRGTIWRSKAHSDGSVWDGWFILGIHTEPGKQITYHLPLSKWGECSFAAEFEKAPDWDGHTSADVLKRLGKL